jgi:lipopolysaccharide export system protein LptA
MAVAVKQGRAELEANTVSVTMSPLSAGVVTVDLGR